MFKCYRHICKLPFVLALMALTLAGCKPEPPLHLYDAGSIYINIPQVELQLDTYWDYETAYGAYYDWRAEWYYGWDETDTKLFGELDFVEPSKFNLRRYFTASTPYAPHTSVISTSVSGNTCSLECNWGYWDFLTWNDITTADGVQSLNFDESSLEYVEAYTNQTMRSSRYQAPAYTRSFYEPELLYAAYTQAIDINRELKGFYFDEERQVWIMLVDMTLEPVTYIYLTQVILHHNRNKIVGVDGSADLSGMARTVKLNDGVAGETPITVFYNTRLKNDCNMNGELVDIAGGRLTTFGICNQNGNRINSRSEVKDEYQHYMDINMQFNNGTDSTFVFDVTEQVRSRWKGGVITIELDMDTIPVPSRAGGSAFNAVVQDYEDGGTQEFEM